MLTLVNACCLSGTVRSRYWRHGDLARHRSTRLPDEVRFPDKLWRRAAADLLLTPSPVRCFFCRSLCERTVVRFADNPYYLLKAYVDSNEGIDRAGGFAIQVRSRPPLTSLSVGKMTDRACFLRPFAAGVHRAAARCWCDASKATTTTWSASPCMLSARSCTT